MGSLAKTCVVICGSSSVRLTVFLFKSLLLCFFKRHILRFDCILVGDRNAGLEAVCEFSEVTN